jgi:hypothetical protein
MRRPPKDESSWGFSGLAAYAEAVLGSSSEAIHDLIVRSGPAILDRGISYLIVAARRRRAETWRTEKRRRDLLQQHGEEVAAALPQSVWDPDVILSANRALRCVVDALSELEDEDVLVVWRHAQGVRDDEIVKEWDERGFQPPAPTTDLIRKRRERARQALRDRLKRGEP